MANCLFDRRKVGPKSLRPQVQLGPALVVRQRVNEVPPLVFYKRQTSLRAGLQPQPPLTALRLTCDVALQKPKYGLEIG